MLYVFYRTFLFLLILRKKGVQKYNFNIYLQTLIPQYGAGHLVFPQILEIFGNISYIHASNY